MLVERLRQAGIETRHLWLRFPFFFSLPLLAYARLRGLSWYEGEGAVRQGYWDFRPSRLLRTSLPWTLLVDAALASLWKITLPLFLGKTVVCERFVLDMLVDLALAFGEADFWQGIPGRFYVRLLPPGGQVFILDGEAGDLQQRRPDLRSDRRLAAKLQAYRDLARDYSFPVFSVELPAGEVNQHIQSWIGLKDA
jgi:hypothetical protein